MANRCLPCLTWLGVEQRFSTPVTHMYIAGREVPVGCTCPINTQCSLVLFTFIYSLESSVLIRLDGKESSDSGASCLWQLNSYGTRAHTCTQHYIILQ